MTDIKTNYPNHEHSENSKNINNNKCIDKCYPKNTVIQHPITLDSFKSSTKNFCSTYPYIINNETYTFIECNVLANNSANSNRISMISPLVSISSDYFIKIYYNIHNFEEMLSWFTNNSDSTYRTKERVFNNGMVVYGTDIQLIDQRFVDHITYILHYNISYIYKSIRKYIKVNKNNIELLNSVYITEKNNNFNDDKHTIQLIRTYIKNTFLNSDTIYQYISKFIRYYKNNLSDKFITTIIVEKMIEYIIKRINLSFE